MPVLSRVTESTCPTRSITTTDFTSTPWRPALAMAESSGGMVASKTAQGGTTIMKVMARSRDPVTPAHGSVPTAPAPLHASQRRPLRLLSDPIVELAITSWIMRPRDTLTHDDQDQATRSASPAQTSPPPATWPAPSPNWPGTGVATSWTSGSARPNNTDPLTYLLRAEGLEVTCAVDNPDDLLAKLGLPTTDAGHRAYLKA